MPKDPLVRSIDATSMRLQLGRRGLANVAGHVLWQEAQHRLKDRFSLIRCSPTPRLDHGLAQYGEPMHVAPGSLQLIWSVGLLAYLADMRATLGFWARSLAPGGLVMLATLGPDSFRSLALALNDAAQHKHVQGYPDMHDIGDALLGAGLADPVMDAEWVTLTYSDATSALADLRALGGNALSARPHGLKPRAWRQKVLSAIDTLRCGDRIELKVELVFGHAWAPALGAPQKRDPTDSQPVRFIERPPQGPKRGI